MRIAELLVPEFDTEMSVARKVLARVPDDDERARWQPHSKSFPFAHLAQHVAQLPGWVPMIIGSSELDIMPENGERPPGYSFEKTQALLDQFDANAAAARAAVAAATDAQMAERWELKKARTVVISGTRYEMIRGMVFNHIVHHRAQLALYLRMLDLSVPPMYGPTADER
jgi:uncharacterized damage-inducible protein DinB